MTYFTRRVAFGATIALAAVQTLPAQNQALSAKIAEIQSRPELIHATFGVAAYDLDAKKMVYGLNAEQLFTPGSTTKLLTTGTALGLLGADYRFHTPVYRTGPITGGVLKGDLVLVGSGDANLSGRAFGDTLGFTNEDHSYAGRGDSVAKALGDPLAVLRELAGQVAAKGIKQVDGRVLVDVSLFPQGERELGTGVVISPIVVNDNVVDLLIAPGAKAGDAVSVRVSPDLGLFRLTNELKTGAPGSTPALRRMITRDSASGVVTVRLTGSYAAGGAPLVMSVPVDSPSEMAARAFVAALKERGITVQGGASDHVDFARLATGYGDSTRVAEHVSLPLAEAVKVILKVSQNLHASMMPYVVGAIAGHTPGRGAVQAGFDAEHDFLQRAGLDLMAAAQGDGAGGAPGAFYSPAFMAQYLAYMATRPDTALFRKALPILGRDGTLWNIQAQAPAAGHVFAKTGTFSVFDPLNRRTIVTGKGLAGYMTTSSGKRLAFAIYANRVPFPPNYPGDAALLVGQALGEIAAAMWGGPIS
ncbi:MAG: D-alanyl-D-alanine carboxypeptidase/D-alanyl-D-alanine-endopeptidase [Gemmatimonadetes bacterium]|nr:D-alanyl-D-alanine carboxypeptidase/D-alanyl-D-alanine-endopeptidase [Gemmatimonadota bacterium]